MRASLGEELVSRIEEEPDNKSYLWSLGRLGARTPLYGPLNCVVPAEVAGRWVTTLLRLPTLSSHSAAATVQIAALANDPLRDVEPEVRQAVVEKLSGAGIDDELIGSLRTYFPPTRADAVRIFGESLPEGLRLIG